MNMEEMIARRMVDMAASRAVFTLRQQMPMAEIDESDLGRMARLAASLALEEYRAHHRMELLRIEAFQQAEIDRASLRMPFPIFVGEKS
jgi:hypothetical protein